MLKEYVEKLKAGKNLTQQEANKCLTAIFNNDLEDREIADILSELAEKGESKDEIIGFAKALLSKALPLPLTNDSIDLCGTGGSGLDRFNVSTASAFILAAGNVKVIKHGNKGSRKPNGSFDFLEKLGVEYDFEENRMKQIFESTGMCFVFARKYHPVMKKVVGARKLLGKRSIFNIIGPLCNPAQPDYQIIGSPDIEKGRVIAESLTELGRKKCLVVSGEPGIDEISISGKTHVFEINKTEITEYDLNPEDFNITTVNYGDIPAGNAEDNANHFFNLINNAANDSLASFVCINSGAAFYCCGKTEDISKGIRLSRQLIQTGEVKKIYEQYISETTN